MGDILIKYYLCLKESADAVYCNSLGLCFLIDVVLERDSIMVGYKRSILKTLSCSQARIGRGSAH